MVDTSRIWWAQLESGIHWVGVVFVRGYGWHLSIYFLSALRQPFWPAACIRFRPRLVRRDLCPLSSRKLSRGRWRQHKSGYVAAYSFAGSVIVLFRYGVL